MTMIKINIHQAKTHLSKYLAKLKKGEIIVICNRNIPVAEIHPISTKIVKPRPVGLAKNSFDIPDAFFEPLPDDFVDPFSGK